MPARKNKIFHDEDTRKKIKVGNLITRMQKFALANAVVTVDDGQIRIEYQDEEGKRVHPLTKEQIAATKILLDKALPNLTSVDVSGETTRTYVLRAPAPEDDAMKWLNKYGPKTIDHKETKDDD